MDEWGLGRRHRGTNWMFRVAISGWEITAKLLILVARHITLTAATVIRIFTLWRLTVVQIVVLALRIFGAEAMGWCWGAYSRRDPECLYETVVTSASAPPLLGPASPSPPPQQLLLIIKTYSQSPPPPHPPPPPPSSLTRTVKWESAPRLLHNSYQLQETPTSPAASESAEPPQLVASLKPQESSMSREQEPRHSQTALPLPMAASSCPSTIDSANFLGVDATNLRLGIGTTTPATTLSVAGNTYLDSNIITIASSSAATTTVVLGNGLNFDSNTFVIDPNSNNVGIGTAAPESKLHIFNSDVARAPSASTLLFLESAGQANIEIVSGTASYGVLAFSDSGGNGRGQIAYNHNGDYLTFETNSVADRMVITSSGLVGIGSTTPASALGVAGSGYFAGNVNLDQFSTYKLNGLTVLSATTTTFNTLAGFYAGANIVSTSTDDTSGIYNTALGYEALRYATSTDGNTAVGYQALRMSSSSSARNSGFYNSAFGRSALTSNTVGDSNSAFGYLALSSNTTGSQNSALGRGALDNNTTGSPNSAIGYYPLQANITGSNNTALGYTALYYNNSATNTVAVGYQAARGTAAYNNQGGTYLGYQAGYSAGTGSDYNTLLGYQAGYGITTGAYNIVIGQNVEAPTVTGNQQLNIGNLVYGTGVYNGGSVSSGPVAGGLLGISTTTPYAKLSVVGGTSGTVIAADAITGFSGNLLDLKVASTTKFVINQNGDLLAYGSTTLQNFTFVNATGTSATTTNFFSSLLTVGGTGLVVGASRNVGIGTAAPTRLLQVNGLANFSQLEFTGDSPSPKIYTSAASDLSLGANNDADQLVLDYGGNVGIQTSFPGNTLEVMGGSGAVGIRINSGDVAIWDVDANYTVNNNLTLTRALGAGGNFIVGNSSLGIATTSPWRALSVHGASDLGINALAGYFTATSTTASVFPYASTTALTVSNQLFLGGIATSSFATLPSNGAFQYSANTKNL